MKYLIFLLLLACRLETVSATDHEGYIIKNYGDSVWGKVDVQMKKVVFGKKELDLADMEQEISFTENNGKSKKIKAADVLGYGFNYSSVWFHFVVLDWPKNNWKKNTTAFERKVNKLTLFIHRAYEGAIPIYKDYFKMAGNALGLSGAKTENTITELYIHTADLGFVEVAPANFGANKKLKDFLMKYLTMEEAFLNTIDEKAKFTEAEEILKAYNEWKKRN
ncbi:MAG: hypothetical protein HZB42_13060 [Sphingobacteriales bacterium]|nr:hypothetical protein [Sphingobacteriales bacterium]